MDAGHGHGESDIHSTDGTRCCNKLEHVMENGAVGQKISVPSLPQTRMMQDVDQLYDSVDNRSSTTLTKSSLKSHTIDR